MWPTKYEGFQGADLPELVQVWAGAGVGVALVSLVDGLQHLELLSLQLLVLTHAGHGGVVCCLYLHSMSEMVWFLLSHYSDSYLVGKSIFKTTFPPPLHQQNFRRWKISLCVVVKLVWLELAKECCSDHFTEITKWQVSLNKINLWKISDEGCIDGLVLDIPQWLHESHITSANGHSCVPSMTTPHTVVAPAALG